MKITPRIKKIIKDNPISFATIKGNKPYVIGVAYCKVVGEDKILVTDNFMKETVKNIAENHNVAMVVWNREWEGYQLLGKAKYYQKGEWLDYVRKMKANKGLPAKGAILITVKKIVQSK